MIAMMRYYYQAFGLLGLLSATAGKLDGKPRLLRAARLDVRFPLFVRSSSSDIPTFEQVFGMHEYAFDVSRPPKTIVDAGANIGLASVYFANKFPGTTIVAIEPDEDNLALLKLNVAPYGNVVPVCAALWHENGPIDLLDTGLGSWGFMTAARDSSDRPSGRVLRQVRGITVDALMDEHGIDRIDILKMDIEGAEREVFTDASAWIGRVDALIVELHERMKSGCSRSFYRGSNGFDSEWLQGENVYLTRRGSCLTPPLPRP